MEYVLKNYKLGPAHFYTTPGLAWLLSTVSIKKRRKDCEAGPGEFRLELLTDIDIDG